MAYVGCCRYCDWLYPPQVPSKRMRLCFELIALEVKRRGYLYPTTDFSINIFEYYRTQADFGVIYSFCNMTSTYMEDAIFCFPSFSVGESSLRTREA